MTPLNEQYPAGYLDKPVIYVVDVVSGINASNAKQSFQIGFRVFLHHAAEGCFEVLNEKMFDEYPDLIFIICNSLNSDRSWRYLFNKRQQSIHKETT